MVIDTSALLPILLREPEKPVFLRALEREPALLVSSASVLEAAVVLLQRFGQDAGDLDELLSRFPVDIVTVDREQLRWARYAFETYGRGRHRARLNFGDCFSYALAKTTGQPILFKGDDFPQTDLEPARF